MKTVLSILIWACAMSAMADVGGDGVDAAYFHPAASLYIRGDTPAASNLVAQGLSFFPDDGKLLRLKELLEKQQEQQDQNDQQQNQDQQDQQQDENQNDQQDQQDQQDQDQQQDEQEQEQQQEQQQQSEPPRAEEMSPDEAQRLLDAMKQEEENKRLLLHPVMGAPIKVDKDW
ncbi:MAG: hypothetical protein KJN98_01300 [Pontiella sp.]|nr:hypothetical protein [Pontiella sp.]